MEVKVEQIGDSLGVILPEELVEALQLKAGSRIKLERKGNELQIQQSDASFETWSHAYQQLKEDYKEVLKALAK
ncbi:transcriptional regulator/antitoxin, MazE [Cyclonatronum proteinivorum]|uniref:Transcriptional regulator/antitoxin, MazE n=1 Tax=Cyclonatronum proteinivorum TaxID=1457365 RepID=A0A345UHP4_9BACT|nr:AbrB/MazE/SpoVT family DNA-binding domain-containing protein [Cyclonatronum proteinivorum]AXI99995.1 transcriptional regulator/antitoxin, MazE [Cyclonatronum proteinivorum]